ncbi:Glutathione ABC superfamily ATP binding cassette transporter, permease protein [Alloalcanivorax dieselolei B5]|uniref:Glutathione ABC superfamily ATP binding cassette transporter, permease protein n=1 Tax=Alcanivorax dieselolei (strain DSM 16502 / CGMCC 1.3690 / MCCC 1A00001 / B-5) TaxID=930169 RepID=K0CAZ9_ALCDB|nr:ABC transporter permease [Alloalcanivorax dieselolei]AFT68847.1 Glutathione ABC superfamily ATP binding cassette transporter, permease protein [Alloalcanivorax dieselolei B5]GGK06236.1 glutathione ABC transporter permease GsiD [Alloalcanivorax dieselolei]
MTNLTLSEAEAEPLPHWEEPALPVRLLRWLRRDPRAAISLGILVIILGAALLAPWIAPYSPTDQNDELILAGPSAAHWLGTDDLGRDVLSRLIHGGANSLYAALLAVSVALAIGLPLGLIAGFTGGWVDSAISRLVDTFLSFPAIILAVAVTGAMGIGLTNAMFSVGLVFAPQIARLIRARTLVVRQELYVDAARCFGASPARLLIKHVLPNAVQPVIVQSTLLLAVALLAEASLSFLGLGVQLPEVSWGSMIARGYLYMSIVPEQMYAPGVLIMITAVAFNALGESLRSALDPTTQGHG